MLVADKVLHIAEREIGVIESPKGSNRGARVQEYQRAVPEPGSPTGWPWCNAALAWMYKRAGLDVGGWMTASTWQTAQNARQRDLYCVPRPAALICWPGRHIELLHTRLTASTWRCIGANVDDAVRWTTRSTVGASIFAAREILMEPVVEDRRPRYWFQDRVAYYGPWLNIETRDAKIIERQVNTGRLMRPFRVTGKTQPQTPTNDVREDKTT